jgi:putative flippase GtrA
MTTPTIIVASPPVAKAAHTSRREAIRYLFASVAALTCDAAILAISVNWFGLLPWVGGAIAYLAGLVLVYLLSIGWVFDRRAIDNPVGEFAIFAALGLVGLILNSATLYIGTAAGLSLPIAKGLSAMIGFTTNFVSRKAILFSGGKR